MPNSIITPEIDENGQHLRRIRSFVRRGGRLTKGQRFACEQGWATMGIDYVPDLLNFSQLFGNNAPVILEVGFGMGASLIEMALANPEQNFLGVEVHEPGIGACIKSAREKQIKNLKLICHDAIEVLTFMIPDTSLFKVQLFFPDPWHKSRHHKRRIVQSDFVALISRKLVKQGKLHMVTDWQPYAEHMLDVMEKAKNFQNLSKTQTYIERPQTRPVTKFEQRGHRLGHGIFEMMFEKYHDNA